MKNSLDDTVWQKHSTVDTLNRLFQLEAQISASGLRDATRQKRKEILGVDGCDVFFDERCIIEYCDAMRAILEGHSKR